MKPLKKFDEPIDITIKDNRIVGTDIFIDSDDFLEIQKLAPDIKWITSQFTTYIRYNNRGFWYIPGSAFKIKTKQISLGDNITEEKLNNLLVRYNVM
jgi:hypothetical protein